MGADRGGTFTTAAIGASVAIGADSLPAPTVPNGGPLVIPPVAAWPSVAVLLALAARSGARLLADRAPADPAVPGCALTSRTGDVLHLAMALGMAVMVAPLGVPPPVLIGYFSVTTAAVAGSWLLRVTRRRLVARRGGTAPCRPAHALEPHHVVIGLAMIVMAAQPAGSGAMGGGMAGMAGASAVSVSAASSVSLSVGWSGLGALSLVYVWASVLFLGGGLAKAAAAQPAPNGTVAVLAAPVTVYACELAMTVVMGLMLLG